MLKAEILLIFFSLREPKQKKAYFLCWKEKQNKLEAAEAEDRLKVFKCHTDFLHAHNVRIPAG